MAEACDKPVIALTDHAGTSIVTQTSLTSSSVDKLSNGLTRTSQYLSELQNLRAVYKSGREHIAPMRSPASQRPAPPWATCQRTLLIFVQASTLPLTKALGRSCWPHTKPTSICLQSLL